MSAIHLSGENFHREVMESEKPVLVDFWASWCGPCRALSPILEEIAGELTDAKVCKLNIDDNSELANEYQVMTIPTLALFREGKLVSTSIGVKPKEEILNMILEY